MLFRSGADSTVHQDCTSLKEPVDRRNHLLIVYPINPIVMMEAVDLDKLKTAIEAISEKIKALKATTGVVDKAAIDAAVNDLVTAKTKFANNNNGIGVDGKPLGETLTKAQKKAKTKAEEGTAGPAKPVRSS